MHSSVSIYFKSKCSKLIRHPQPCLSPSFRQLRHTFLIFRQIDRYQEQHECRVSEENAMPKAGYSLSSPSMASYVSAFGGVTISFAGVDEVRPANRTCTCAYLRIFAWQCSKPETIEGRVRFICHKCSERRIRVSRLLNVLSLRTSSRKRASNRELARQGSQLGPDKHIFKISLPTT